MIGARAAQERVGGVLEFLARMSAYFGGLILVFLSLMTVASIAGRWVNAYGIRSLHGDYELIEAGCAIAVFAFLPYCQLRRGHVTVDVFITRLPGRIRTLTALIGDILITGLAYLILWRLYLGFGEKFPYFPEVWRDRLAMGYKPFFAQTTYELQIPIWIPFGLAVIGAALFFVVSVYTVWRTFNRLLAGDVV